MEGIVTIKFAGLATDVFFSKKIPNAVTLPENGKPKNRKTLKKNFPINIALFQEMGKENPVIRIQ